MGKAKVEQTELYKGAYVVVGDEQAAVAKASHIDRNTAGVFMGQPKKTTEKGAGVVIRSRLRISKKGGSIISPKRRRISK